MSIKLYLLQTNLASGNVVQGVEDASETIANYSLSVSPVHANVTFTHFMDKELAVQCLNLGRKLASNAVLQAAAGQGKTYAERNSQAQKKIYLDTCEAAFRCFLNAATAANVSLYAWNKLRRVMEVATCISPWLRSTQYTASPIVNPAWATGEDGMWRNSMANINIGLNTWMPNAVEMLSGSSVGPFAIGASSSSAFRNMDRTGILASTKLSQASSLQLAPTPHIRFGVFSEYFLSCDGVPGDNSLKYMIDCEHMTTLNLRMNENRPGDSHPFWFNEDNEFVSKGLYDGVYPGINVIREGVDRGTVANVNTAAGDIPGIYGVPGIKRDFFKADSGNSVFYECSGTPPFDWYLRLFFATIPGLRPGIDTEDLYTDGTQDAPGMSLADYILTVGIERFVAEVKSDAILNIDKHLRKVPFSRGESQGVLDAASSVLQAASGSDPGSRGLINAVSSGLIGLGGGLTATGLGALPGAVVASAGVVAALFALTTTKLSRDREILTFAKCDVYGKLLAHNDSGEYAINPTKFLGTDPSSSNPQTYVGALLRRFREMGIPTELLRQLPSSIKVLVDAMPNGVSGVRPPAIAEPPSALIQSATVGPNDGRIVFKRTPLTEMVVVQANGKMLNGDEIIAPDKYTLVYSMLGEAYGSEDIIVYPGETVKVRIPDPPSALLQSRVAQSGYFPPKQSSVLPWILALGAAGGGYYLWDKYKK